MRRLVRMERDRKVNLAMESLSPEHRMVLTLIALEDLSHKQVAEVLGVAEGTIWSRYARARIALAQEFQKTGFVAEDVLED